MRRIEAVFFDLDGTLVDSAPDLAASANHLRAQAGLPPLPLEHLRPHVGSGARGMLGAGLGLTPAHADYERLRTAFLADYATRLLDSTQLFAQVPALLAGLGQPWGIVTNKTLALAQPIQQALLPQARTLVGGDCTPHRKPHPAPLLEAARRLQVAPEACLYVGDDPRDMQAARSAGMPALAAGWGYLGADLPIESWGADAILDQPLHLLDWLAA